MVACRAWDEQVCRLRNALVLMVGWPQSTGGLVGTPPRVQDPHEQHLPEAHSRAEVILDRRAPTAHLPLP